MRRAPRKRRHHVVQRRGAERRHQADARAAAAAAAACAPGRTGPGFQPGLALQELLEQRALAGPAQAFDDQLQVAARLVDAQPAPHLDLSPSRGDEIQQAGRAAEHGAANLARFVLQREVAMPAGRAREAGNLAPHRDRVEAGIQRISDGAAQRADWPRLVRHPDAVCSRSAHAQTCLAHGQRFVHKRPLRQP